jgi:hypothetical protein
MTTPLVSPVPGSTREGRPSRRRRCVLAALLLVVVALVAVGVARPFGKGAPAKAGVVDNATPTSLATVRRQTLTSQTELSATLGYARSYTVVNQAGGSESSGSSTTSSGAASGGGPSGGTATGTFTSLPRVGERVIKGRVLYRVDGNPVVLFYGETPAYRSLSEGMTGGDVEELNANLVALGYATRSELDPTSDEFSWETASALEKLQAHLGETKTGTLDLGQAVFLPSAARVTSLLATLGGPAASGATVLQATSTKRQVSIALDPAQQSGLKVGDRVTISLPNNRSTPGVISSVGTVATTAPSESSASGSAPGSSGGDSGAGLSGSGSPTITVLVRPRHPAATGRWDQAPVNVTITTGSVDNALVVPVNALLALSRIGYAVEVVGAGGTHHLVAVSLGLFDDDAGLVQVTGSGLAAGERVVVAAV